MTTMASQITSLTIAYPTVFQAQVKENIEAPRHWHMCGEFTGDRWSPRTKGQWRGKKFPFDDVIGYAIYSHCQSLKAPHFLFILISPYLQVLCLLIHVRNYINRICISSSTLLIIHSNGRRCALLMATTEVLGPVNLVTAIRYQWKQ